MSNLVVAFFFSNLATISIEWRHSITCNGVDGFDIDLNLALLQVDSIEASRLSSIRSSKAC